MLNALRYRLLLWTFERLMEGGDPVSEQMKRVFATTYVALILAGRRTIDDVPEIILDIVKADLGIE